MKNASRENHLYIYIYVIFLGGLKTSRKHHPEAFFCGRKKHLRRENHPDTFSGAEKKHPGKSPSVIRNSNLRCFLK